MLSGRPQRALAGETKKSGQPSSTLPGGTKLVILNHNRGTKAVAPNHAPADAQLERAISVQLIWPRDSNVDGGIDGELFGGLEQQARTADITYLSVATPGRAERVAQFQ